MELERKMKLKDVIALIEINETRKIKMNSRMRLQ